MTLPGGVTEAALRVAVTPAGCPLTDRATGTLNTPLTVVVNVKLPLDPCTADTEGADPASVKVEEPTVSVIVTACLSAPLVPLNTSG